MTGSGLEGVVAAATALSHVDGERGELIIAGFPVGELAEQRDVRGNDVAALARRAAVGARARGVPRRARRRARRCRRDARAAARRAHARSVEPMDALRMAAGTLSLVSDEARRDRRAASRRSSPPTGGCGTGDEPLAPRADLGHAANFLYMLTGEVPDAERVRGLETYLNTVVDHGLNASTFTARVITSTGSDLVSAVVGALGALKGPLHGGAPGPALDMVFEIGDASRAEAVLRRKIEAGEKLMGFGHRVYKVRDPRADVLAAAAERMFTRAGDMSLYTLARAVEAHGAAAARGVQARTPAADERRVLHRAAAARPRPRRRAVHADLRRSAASAAGSRTRSSSAAPTGSSGRSPSMSVLATGRGRRCRPVWKGDRRAGTTNRNDSPRRAPSCTEGSHGEGSAVCDGAPRSGG